MDNENPDPSARRRKFSVRACALKGNAIVGFPIRQKRDQRPSNVLCEEQGRPTSMDILVRHEFPSVTRLRCKRYSRGKIKEVSVLRLNKQTSALR